LPLWAVIWSASVQGMRAFPARYFEQFLHSHERLSLTDRPAWRKVAGGAREYITRLTRDQPDLRLGTGVRLVVRDGAGITLRADRRRMSIP
jgi:hypothetical protein